MTTAQDGGKVVSLTQRPPLPPGNILGTHFYILVYIYIYTLITALHLGTVMYTHAVNLLDVSASSAIFGQVFNN